MNTNTTPPSAEKAYTVVSTFLARKKSKKTQSALSNYKEELQNMLGHKYSQAMFIIVDAYFHIDKYAPNGIPMEVLYDMIEKQCSHETATNN